MLTKLTRGKKPGELSPDEKRNIYGGGLASLFCNLFLAFSEPDACGIPVDGTLMQHIIDSESKEH